MRQTVGILGTPIDRLDTGEVLERLEQFIRERRFHQVATANTDFLVNALGDAELRYILRNADLVVPDGMPVVWASRLMKAGLPERVTGADIVPELAALAARKGYRIYMLGAKPSVAQCAKAKLLEAHPNLQIVGCVSPELRPLVDMDNETILADIERAQPDILLVAFGNPKQEKWIHMHRERLQNVPVCIGVGGTFDFLAGNTARAPHWMQVSGLEWLHRLLHEPRRLWKRYVRDISHFSRYLVMQWWALRHNWRRTQSELLVAEVQADGEDHTILSVSGGFDSRILVRFQAVANEAINNNRHLVFDFSNVKTIDGAAIGTLINLTKRAAHCNRHISLVSLPNVVAAAFRRSLLNDGLFRTVDTVAQAFTNGHPVGLCWQVMGDTHAAVVTASGASDAAVVQNLGKVCERLLKQGKRVDFDGRGLTYVDVQMLTMLHRLNGVSGADDSGKLRLVVGSVLRAALVREKLLETFTVLEAPDVPQDAVEEACDILEMAAEDVSPLQQEALYARGV